MLESMRSLLRRPGYTLVAVTTLAVGIGVSTGIFSLLHATLLQPLPYEEADRLVRFRHQHTPTGGSGAVTTANFLDLREQASAFESLAGYTHARFNLAGPETAERVAGLQVTSDFLKTLGVAPIAGRGFRTGEDREGREPVAVISHRLWRTQFDGRSDVVGQPVRLDAIPHTVVGVLPESFWFPGDPEVVVPFAWTADQAENRGGRWLEGLGRMAEDVSLDVADADLKATFEQIKAVTDQDDDWTVRAWSFREFAVGNNRGALLLLTGAVLLILLIGSVNVASLMLVRAERSGRDMAIRAALGANRRQLVSRYLQEGLLLAGMGGLAGIAVAWASMRLLLAVFGDGLRRASEVEITLPVLGFGLVLALLTGVVVALIPALRVDVHDLLSRLREGGRGGGGRSRTLQALVTAEVAVAVLLTVGAGLLVNSFVRLNAVETGLDLDNALTFSVEIPSAVYDSAPSIHQFYNDAVDRIGALPGVRHVGITERTPLQGGYNITTLPSPDDPEIEASFVEVRRVTPDYFAAAGIPVLGGRGFTEADGANADNVVAISDELARTIFPDGDAVGRTILPGWWDSDEGFRVVGVVGSVREFGLARAKRPAVYWPWGARGAATGMVFIVRTHGDPTALVPSIRGALAELDATIPLYGARTLRDVAIATTGSRWLATTLFTAFGILALVLTAIGIFGVLAYVVEQRNREIGVRIAVGATTAAVLRMVLSQGLRLVAIGILVGGAAAIAGGSLLADLLYEVQPADPLTLLSVTTVVLAVALAAMLLPAWRAVRVEPVTALRME